MTPIKHEILASLPEFLSSRHLVQIGIYSSIDAAYQARLAGFSPQYIKMRHRILYPKKAVLDFLEQRMRTPNNSSATTAS